MDVSPSSLHQSAGTDRSDGGRRLQARAGTHRAAARAGDDNGHGARCCVGHKKQASAVGDAADDSLCDVLTLWRCVADDSSTATASATAPSSWGSRSSRTQISPASAILTICVFCACAADFFFLEEISRSTNSAARSRSTLNANARRYTSNKKRKVATEQSNTGGSSGAINPDIPADWLARFPVAVQLFAEHSAKRAVALTLLAPGMSKRARNSSYMDMKKNTLFWRVEWAFPSAEVPVSHSEERASEKDTLFALLSKYFTPCQENVAIRGKLKKYAVADWEKHILLLLRKEFTPASQPQYYRLDGNQSLESNLKRKAVVEFPVITVALVDDAGQYPVAHDVIETISSETTADEQALTTSEPEPMEMEEEESSSDDTSSELLTSEATGATAKLFSISDDESEEVEAPPQPKSVLIEELEIPQPTLKSTCASRAVQLGAWRFADLDDFSADWKLLDGRWARARQRERSDGDLVVRGPGAQADDLHGVLRVQQPVQAWRHDGAALQCMKRGRRTDPNLLFERAGIYDATGEESLSEIALKDIVGNDAEGTSIGKLLVIGKEEDAKAGEGSGFEVCKTLTGHDEPICCVESSLDGNLLASSDMSGAILIHNPIDGFEITHRIVSKGYPATSMTFMAENWLVAGFLTGYLRLYNPETFRVHAEVAAHTRAITALDAHNEFAVSVSEDTFMNVWEISSSKPGAGPRVKLVSSQAVPNDLLTGVVFASMNNLFTATYDTAHLKFWSPE
ncbi:hypothetical protein ON010_g5630 [Phytophthora cinnamomi]|nr:hypothetical protein ON010_g5630 [Phytophthora cinnamomi]